MDVSVHRLVARDAEERGEERHGREDDGQGGEREENAVGARALGCGGESRSTKKGRIRAEETARGGRTRGELASERGRLAVLGGASFSIRSKGAHCLRSSSARRIGASSPPPASPSPRVSPPRTAWTRGFAPPRRTAQAPSRSAKRRQRRRESPSRALGRPAGPASAQPREDAQHVSGGT